MNRFILTPSSPELSEAGRLLPPEVTYSYLPQADSTNALALSGDWPQYAVLAADCQTGGRGRLGRAWVSPPGVNLYFSMVFNPQVPTLSWGSFSLVSGIAVSKVLAGAGFAPGLKWPNDVLLAGRKVAGILVEARDQRLVAGIGINVNQTEFGELTAKAASLAQVAGSSRDRAGLLTALVTELINSYRQWHNQGFELFISEWNRYDVLAGKITRARFRGCELVGTAMGITDTGELVLNVAGVDVKLHSGDVSLESVYR